MRKKYFWILLLVVCCLNACGQPAGSEREIVDNQAEELQGLEKVAELPEQDCYLYRNETDKLAVVCFQGQQFSLHRDIFSSNFILPDLYCGDYDGDGENEVALSLHTGHGTGVCIDELLLIDWTEGEASCCEFQYDDYLQQVKDRTEWEWNAEKKELQLQIDGEWQEKVWKLDAVLAEAGETGGRQDKDIFEGVIFGDQVSFREEDGKLLLELVGGYQLRGYAMLFYEGETVDLQAEVVYRDGSFELNDLNIQKKNRTGE